MDVDHEVEPDDLLHFEDMTRHEIAFQEESIFELFLLRPSPN
jgi:hypothetical protein